MMKMSDILGNIEFAKTAVDSRKVEKGDLFAVFTGDSDLNKKYAEDAVARGAAAVLTDDEMLSLSVPVVCRKDAALLLGEINKKLYQPLPEVFAAVTGTNGKTSTVSFLRQIWIFPGLMPQASGLSAFAQKTKPNIQAGQRLIMLRCIRSLMKLRSKAFPILP